VASDFAHTERGVYDFFGLTFYAHQYDPEAIRDVIGRILQFLQEENMIEVEGENLAATQFGRRVSELYLDPVSAVMIREAMANRAPELTEFSLLHMVAHTPDMVPRLRPYRGEADRLSLLVEERGQELMFEAPDEWTDRMAYEEFLGEAKLAQVLEAWIQESTEDEVIGQFQVQPGDLYRLTETARWLLYASHELALLLGHRDLSPRLSRLTERVKDGVKAELLPLVRLRGVGRVRARVLHDSGLRNLGDLRRAPMERLTALPTIGPRLAKSIKEQAGGLVKPREWKDLKKGEAWEQQALTEY